MSVYLPKGSSVWLYDFQHQGVRYYGSTGQKTRRTAETVERDERQAVKAGSRGGAALLTLDEGAGKWWEEVGRHRKDARRAHPDRKSKLELRIESMLEAVGAALALGDIDQTVVARAIERRRGRTYRRSPAKDAREYRASNATVNRDVIDTLRPILRRARTHWTPKGKPSGLPEIDWRELRLKEPPETVRVYSPAQKASWLEHASRTGWRAGKPRWNAADLAPALDLILTNGLRFGELFFHPSRFVTDEAGRPILDLTTGRKGDVPHRVPLLARQAEALAPLVAAARLAGLPHVWHFLGPKGRPIAITPAGVEARLQTAAKKAGVPPGRLIHGGRHHAGTMAYRNTRNMKTVQKLLGHADAQSTLRYVHADDSAVRAMLEEMDQAAAPAPAADAPGADAARR